MEFFLVRFFTRKLKRYHYARFEKENIKNKTFSYHNLIRPWGANELIVYVNGNVVFDSRTGVPIPPPLLKTIRDYFDDIENNPDVLLSSIRLSKPSKELDLALMKIISIQSKKEKLASIRKMEQVKKALGIPVVNNTMKLGFSQEIASLEQIKVI